MDDRQDRIDAARKLLDWLEARPDVPLPFELGCGLASFNIYVYGHTAQRDMADIVRTGGAWHKRILGDRFEMMQLFGHEISLTISADQKDICTRVVTERKVIPAHTIPARDIPEAVEEVVEWNCPDSLLRAENAEAHQNPAG